MRQKASSLKSLLLIWSMILLGCQAEDLHESASTYDTNSPIVRKKFNEFNRLPGLLSEVLPSELLAMRGMGSGSPYEFKIDSTSVTQIINNGVAYYTMAILRENMEEGVFENLVVFDDGTKKRGVLVKYKPDEAFLSRQELIPDTQFTGKFNMTELTYSNLHARSYTTTKCFVNTHLYCTNNVPPTLAGPGCYENRDGGAHVKSATVLNCFEVVVNEPEPYLTNTFVLNPTNSDAGGGNPDIGIPVATQPVFLGNIQLSFIRRLTAEQKLWWDSPDNTMAVVSILNLLNQNTYDGLINLDAMAFAKKMIDYAIATGISFEFDGEITPDPSREVNDLEALEASLNQIEISSVAIDQQPSIGNTFLGSYKFKINLLTGLRMNVKFSVSRNFHHTVTNVTSEEYGASLGEWKQSDYFVDILPNQNIKIEVVGSMTYDYTIEGWGVKIIKGIRMVLVVSPSDATIVSSEGIIINN